MVSTGAAGRHINGAAFFGPVLNASREMAQCACSTASGCSMAAPAPKLKRTAPLSRTLRELTRSVARKDNDHE